MRKLTLALMVLAALVFLPLSAFAQTDFGATSDETSSEFEQTSEPPTEQEPIPDPEPPTEPVQNVMIFNEGNSGPPETGVFKDFSNVLNEDGTYTWSTHAPLFENEQGEFVPYQLTEDAGTVIVETDGVKFSFDKNIGTLTIIDNDGILINSDSYIVRQAQLNTDDWNELTVNDESVVTTVEESDDKAVITFIRENFEGIFKIEYIISSEMLKTTAFFTNNSFEESKFAFTETIQLPDSIISLNSMEEIDLSDYVGMTVQRQVLEENEDLILQIKDLYYNAGIGFDKLWSVKILDNNTVALDFANVLETRTDIGETVELDPTFNYNSGSSSGSISGGRTFTFTAIPSANEVYYWQHSGNFGQGFNAGHTFGGGTQSVTTSIGDGSAWDYCYDSTPSHQSSTWQPGYSTGWKSFDCSAGTSGGSTDIGSSGDAVLSMLQSGTGKQRANSNCNYWSSTLGAGGCTTGNVYGTWTVSVQYGVLPPPSAPQDLIVHNHGDKIHLTWKDGGANQSIDYYEVYGIAGIKLATVQVSEGQSFWHTGTNTAVPYVIGNSEQYYVLAHNNSGFSSASGSSAVIVGGGPPLAPTGLTASKNGQNIDLSWTAGGGNGHAVTGYRIDAATENDLSSIPNNWDTSNAGGGGDEVGYTTGVGTWTKDSGSSQWGDSKVASFEKFTAPNKDYILSYQAVTLDNEVEGIDWANWQSGSASATDPIVGVTEGVIGKAGDFTSTTAMIATGDSAPNNLNEGSISIWFHPTTTGQSNGNPFSSNGYGCYAYQQGQWSYPNETMYCGGLQTGANVFNLNEWNHLVITKSQSTGNGQIYLNGVLEIDASEVKTPNHLVDGLFIGGQYHSSPQLKYPFTGYIDELSTWDTKLSASDVRQLYNNGLGNTPDSVSGYQDDLMMYLNFDDDQVPVANMAKTDIHHDAFSFDFSPSSASSTGFFGLGQGKLQHNDLNTSSKMSDSMKFGYFIAGESKVYEDDDRTTAKNVQASFNADDVYRISVDEGGKVQYWRQASGTGNFNLEYTSPHKAVGAYYIQGNHNTNAEGFEDIVVNEIDWTVKDSWTGNTNTSYTHTGTVINQMNYYRIQAGSSYNVMGDWSNNPTIYSIQPTGVASSGVTSNTSTNCPTGIDSYVWYLRNYNSNPSNNGCRSPYADMSISSIPDSAKITDITAQYQNDWINGVGGVTEWNSMENAFSGNILDTWNDQTNTLYGGDTYVEIDDGGLKPVNALTFVKLGSLAELDATNQLTSATSSGAPTDTFAVAFPYSDTTQTVLRDNGYKNFQTEISYSMIPYSFALTGVLPAAPTNLAATTTDPIVLTWTASPDPDPNSPVLHYSIERSTDGTNWTTLSANIGNVVTYTDNTTTAGTIYHYKVSATTNAGIGPASTPTSASAGTVSTPPQTLAVTQTAVGQLDLSWAAPADDGSTGGITGYKVYRDGAVIATLGNVLIYNDATIAAGTQYTYTVTALNAAGESTISNGIVITSWAVPDAPTGATASGGIPIIVNWNAPNSDRPITDYKVYRDGSLVATVTAPTLTYSDSNVTPNTTYSYTISAVSAVGEGAQSSSTSGQSGVPPDQITTFTATPVDSSRIKLDWAAPNDNGYAITSYKIYQGGNLVGTTSGLTYTDTGLQNNTTYSYTVTAVNIGGEGTQSAAQTATTATPLSPPTNVYTEEHVTSVTVTWDKVIGAVSYTVERDGVVLGTTTDFWYVDSTAAASTSYSYKVYANSSAINGINGTTNTVTTASATSHQYITVTPTAPNANAYPIDMYELHRNGAMVGYLEPNNLVYEDHDVSIGTTYTYQVRAHNLLGWSQLSPVGSVTTWNVPDVITTLSGSVGSPIILNWSAPNSDKPITLYTIYRDGSLLATTTNLTYSDTSVAAGSTYVYTATATSIIGEGIQSAGLSLQAGTVSTVPQNAAVTAQAGNNILFSWQAPSSNGGVPITGYNPQVSTDGGTTWTDLLTTPTTALSFTHTGLVTGQNYSYQVTAINTVGNSPYTAALSVIAGDVPAQVTGLTTTAVSDTEIDLTWNVPANNAYPVSSYNVLRSTDGVTWTTLSSTTNSYSDTGLTADTNYAYKVSAVNILGTGAESSVVQQRTFGLPDPVTTITLTPQSTTQINLSWTQPNLNGFSLVGYTVQQSTDSGVTWTTLSTQTSTTYSATALTQNTVYDFRINTENSFGSVDGTLNTATTYPFASNLISGVTQSDTEIQVTWNAIAGNGAVQYSLERSADSGVTWTPATIYLTSTTYTDTGLTPLSGYNYRVISVNSAGLSSPSISSNTVTTFGQPEAPTNLALTALLNAEIQLDWSAPTVNNGGPVTGYNIERSTDGTTWSVLVNNVSGLTYTDTGLTTSQVYYYKVSAVNAYGISAFSASANAMASDVPSQVTGLTATPLTNYEIQLDWTAPNSNGYSISGYTIERSTDSGTTWTVLVADTQNTNVTYTDINLTVSQTYDYKISAINQVGTGTASTAANAQAGSIPDAPAMTLTALPNNTIQLDWTVPATNGFAITTYAVERSTDGVNWSPLVAINANTYQDTGLTNSATYYYKVTAVNQIGNSAFSAPVSVIAGDVPAQVTGLTATTTSNTSIDLAWTAPNDNGYAISGYMIERSTDNGVTWSTLVADTQSLATAHSDTGLTTGTYYTYKISAINSLGTGPASATSTSHAGGVPDVTVLTATPSASGQIILSWTVPGDNGFALSKYLVERSTDGITYTSIASIVPSTGVTTHTDTGVVGTLYYYKVTVENAIGFSADSNIESLNAGDVPGVVTNLAGTTQSDTQLNLTWNAATPNGYPVTGYMIEQSVDNVTWTTLVPDTQNTQTTYNVSGLTQSTDYYYRVSAINAIGTGSLSNTVQLHTFGPPDAIGAVSSTATSTSVTLSWSTPYSHGSPVTGYKIEVQDFVTGNWLNLATVTTTTYTQINMIPNTQYEYRITAINPYGTSYSPNTVVSTLSTASGTPTVTVISGTELRVDWAAATGTGVTYNIYTSSDDITYTAGPVGHPTAYYNHQGLSNGQTVYYKVTVVNTSGESAQSPSAVGTTYTTPDAPTNIQVTHSTPLSATITWTAPANDGGDPTNLSYTLQRSNDNANWMSLQATAGLTATDSPLTPGSQYYWRVNSLNSAGIGGTSGTVSYLAPDLPTAPGSLTAALTGSNNNAAVLNWVAPSSTSGYAVIGYHIEVNENSGTWTTLVADTGNSGLVYTNTGLSAGSSYVYRVSAITAVGEGTPSNTATVNPILLSLSITGTATGGNSVSVSPTVTTSGSSSATIVQQALYRDNVRVDLVSLNIPLTSGASIPSMIDYPTQTSSYVMTLVLDTGYVIQSNNINLTPSAPFTGEISFSEDRTEYNDSVSCLAAGGTWAAPTNPLSNSAAVCDISYTESVLEFTVQPVGADVIISYQPQNLNEPAIIKSFTATSSAITETIDVDPETDYYGSIIVNPTFEYTTNADGSITVICDANDIMCDDSDNDPNTAGVQSNVPKGTPSEKTFKSFKSPDSTRQLGIEPMGDLFGVNMVFIFVIAMAGIFTGRSAPMGVIFIAVTLGIMAYLGYIDFGSTALNTATWALLIISAVLGIFLGKRYA